MGLSFLLFNFYLVFFPFLPFPPPPLYNNSKRSYHSSLPIHLRYRNAAKLKKNEDHHKGFYFTPISKFYTTCPDTLPEGVVVSYQALLKSLLPENCSFSLFDGNKKNTYLMADEGKELFNLLNSSGWRNLQPLNETNQSLFEEVPIANSNIIIFVGFVTFIVLCSSMIIIIYISFMRNTLRKEEIIKKATKGKK